MRGAPVTSRARGPNPGPNSETPRGQQGPPGGQTGIEQVLTAHPGTHRQRTDVLPDRHVPPGVVREVQLPARQGAERPRSSWNGPPLTPGSSRLPGRQRLRALGPSQRLECSGRHGGGECGSRRGRRPGHHFIRWLATSPALFFRSAMYDPTARYRGNGAPTTQKGDIGNGPVCGTAHVRAMVPGAGLEPARPRGAARFKLAVSAFHHPGLARGSALAHDPIRGAPPISRTVARCCLILLTV